MQDIASAIVGHLSNDELMAWEGLPRLPVPSDEEGSAVAHAVQRRRVRRLGKGMYLLEELTCHMRYESGGWTPHDHSNAVSLGTFSNPKAALLCFRSHRTRNGIQIASCGRVLATHDQKTTATILAGAV